VTDPDLRARAHRLHAEAIVIDTHCDTLGRVFEGRRRLGERSDDGQFDLPRALAGGLTAEVMATFVSDSRQGDGVRQSIDFIDVLQTELAACPGLAMLATTGDHVRQAKREGRVALVMGMEGAEGLGGSLRALRVFHALGLRVLGVTWNRRNEAAEGVGDMGAGGGLSRFGVDLVRECDRLGILIDLSHLGPAGVDGVLATSERPVVATHANAAAVHVHPRNLEDRQLEAIAATGGVIGVVPVPPFLGDFHATAPFERLFDHLDHMLRVVGDDHVGFGLDFDGVGEMRTEGIETVAALPSLTVEMLRRGYPEDRIRKLLGGNFLRVFDAVFDGP
jgi:membrane dipeptidase